MRCRNSYPYVWTTKYFQGYLGSREDAGTMNSKAFNGIWMRTRAARERTLSEISSDVVLVRVLVRLRLSSIDHTTVNDLVSSKGSPYCYTPIYLTEMLFVSM